LTLHGLDPPLASFASLTPQRSGHDLHHTKARRAGLAAFVGTTIEWYDFYVYATAAALVFGPLFFPSKDPLAETSAAFATFAVAFLVRPIGGILFGHIGDKLGRRVSLVITLLLMGASTVLVGCLPTYENVGILAPILLILLRALQGLAVGGEWGGAVLMSVEHAPEKSKTFYGGFTQLGNPAGALLASGIFAIMSRGGGLHPERWLAHPFLLSIVLIAVASGCGTASRSPRSSRRRSRVAAIDAVGLRAARELAADPAGHRVPADLDRRLLPRDHVRHRLRDRRPDLDQRAGDPRRDDDRLVRGVRGHAPIAWLAATSGAART
jgi:MFS family permease